MIMAWFIFNTNSDPTNPLSYTITSGIPSCNLGNNLCAIQTAEGSGNRPILDCSIREEILCALANETPSTNVRLKVL
ncbi:hypothetical protein SAMN04488522_105456 [Pedobacter caeni]|uniref:Uncharacterized protein n=1 Tax=Pedobacter caeni TaxID=288992 RepID=A0A1M5JPH0_9SPHI|nr:hypothetical protein SAMN04488522_105456 [Pedobacter caeni]